MHVECVDTRRRTGGCGGGGNNNCAQEETDLGDTWFGMSSVEWRLLRL